MERDVADVVSMNSRSSSEELGNVNLMDLRPVRAASWEEDDGKVVLVRTPPEGAKRRRLKEWLRFWLSCPRIRLDERSSRVWQLLDGERSVGEIVQQLRSEFGAEVEPAEPRVGELIRRLRDERLLAYPGWDEIPDDTGSVP